MTKLLQIVLSLLVGFGLSYLLFIELDRITNIQLYRIIELQEQVDNINLGGCGYFAMRLYERLPEDQYRIVSMQNGRHYAIQDIENGCFIDANGYRDSLSYQLRGYTKFESISYDSLRALVYKIEIWNPTFKRRDTTLIRDFIDDL